jgi:hypothetical protein
MTPEMREEIMGVVTRGYQRLLTFESPTGGFNWWGDSDPGNRILSAIMLWHLKDLESLIEVDEAVRERTLKWLLDQQDSDGHWASGDALHSGNEVLGTNDERTTAFITWALAHTDWADAAVDRASGWLKTNIPDQSDLYANALSANALALTSPTDQATSSLLSRLDSMKESNAEGHVTWPSDKNANGAMSYLVSNKDAVGSWYNTQATMNALRALLAAASPQGSDAEGTVTLTVNGQTQAPISVTKENGDVYRAFDLTDLVGPGQNTVRLSMVGSGEITYQLNRRVYRPTPPVANNELDLSIGYSNTSPIVGEAVRAEVQATFTGQGQRDQVIVRVGRAPGFAPLGEDLQSLVSSQAVSRYEMSDTHITFYLMGMQANQTRDLSFRMTPTIPVTAEAPGSEIYVYYEPSIRSEVGPEIFTVSR